MSLENSTHGTTGVPKLTIEQAIILTVITGSVLTPMINVLEDISRRLGRKVMAEEFKNPEFIKNVQMLYMDEFLMIVAPEKKSSILLPEGVDIQAPKSF